jgi:rhodanese-related sulfurtransferase
MKTITTEELKAMLGRGEDFVLINVLPEKDFREAHISGSANIPVTDQAFVQRVEELAGTKARPIVVYCANAECNASPTAARTLQAHGFTDIRDYEAGIEGWRNAGLTVESGTVSA